DGGIDTRAPFKHQEELSHSTANAQHLAKAPTLSNRDRLWVYAFETSFNVAKCKRCVLGQQRLSGEHTINSAPVRAVQITQPDTKRRGTEFRMNTRDGGFNETDGVTCRRSHRR